MKRLTKLAALLLAGIMLVGCGGTTETEEVTETQETESSADPEKTTIKIGATPAWEARINFLPEKMAELGYDVQIEVFEDVTTVNQAVMEGSLDMAICQNLPYMKAFNESNNGNLVACEPLLYYDARTLISDKYETVDEIPDGAKVGVGDDVSNQNRDLQVFEMMGFIELAEIGEDDYYTVNDIVSNPHNFEFVEMPWAQKFAAVPDLDFIISSVSANSMQDTFHVIMTTYDLVKEDPNNPEMAFASNAAVVDGNQDKQWCKDVMENLCGDELREILEADNETWGNVKLVLY